MAYIHGGIYMIITQNVELLDNKSLIEFKCDFCNILFYRTKKVYLKNGQCQAYCSNKCVQLSRSNKQHIKCANCNKNITRQLSQVTKYVNHFCSHSCNAIYQNTHKTKGYRRSKLEIWLESELTKIYPNLHFIFNDKTAIISELDIYIPSLNLAFELNGVFHYKPIFGEKKFNKIQNNDNNKFQLCIQNNISLCVIDTSDFTHFKPIKAQKER